MRTRKDRLIGFRITKQGFDDIRAAASQMSIHMGEPVSVSEMARLALLMWVEGVEQTARAKGADASGGVQ
jgi:hypothetical protein